MRQASAQYKFLVLAVTLALLVPATSEAAAVLGAEPGFWVGFLDGASGLIKLLISPLVQMTIIKGDVQSWWYEAGVYLGALSFAGAAGLAAAPAEGRAPVTSAR
jgi:hypothetical protein